MLFRPAGSRLAVGLLGIAVTGFCDGQEVETGTPETSDLGHLSQEMTYPLARYESLWQRSLFHAPRKAVIGDPAFSREFSLAGIFEMDGKTTAALVRNRDGAVVNVSDHFSEGESEAAEGMRLISVETAAGAGGTRVLVEKSGQQAWIKMAVSLNHNPGGAASASASSSTSVAPPDISAPDATAEFSDWESFTDPLAARPPIKSSAFVNPKPPAASTVPDMKKSTPDSAEVSAPSTPLAPSPLDAVLAEDQNEVVVPIPEQE